MSQEVQPPPSNIVVHKEDKAFGWGKKAAQQRMGKGGKGSSYHALWVWNSHPPEELVGAEHLLVPGNEIPFEQELKKIKIKLKIGIICLILQRLQWTWLYPLTRLMPSKTTSEEVEYHQDNDLLWQLMSILAISDPTPVWLCWRKGRATNVPAWGKFNSFWVKFSLDALRVLYRKELGHSPTWTCCSFSPRQIFLELRAPQREENIKTKSTAQEAVQCQPQNGTAPIKELCCVGTASLQHLDPAINGNLLWQKSHH